MNRELTGAYLVFIEKGADLEHRSNADRTALFLALARGRDTVAVKLINNGGEFKQRISRSEWYSVHLGCEQGCLKAVILIVERGGAPEAMLEKN